MSDYLWDKAGEPDADVAYLERALAPLGHRAAPLPPLPARASTVRAPAPRRLRAPAAALAAVALAAVLTLLVVRPWRPRGGWELPGGGRVAVGAWIDTHQRVALRVGSLGTVELAAGSRARIVDSGGARERIALERGTLSARIDAAPRRFAVATPRATVTDLGCAFTVGVDDAGRAHVAVAEGRVAIAAGGAAETLVPAGAQADVAADGTVALPTTPTTPATPTTPTTPPTPPTTPALPTTAPATHAPSTHATHAPSTHATHAPATRAPSTHAPAHAAPTRAPAHKPAAPPARKPDAPPHLSHDPLKDLERSVE